MCLFVSTFVSKKTRVHCIVVLLAEIYRITLLLATCYSARSYRRIVFQVKSVSRFYGIFYPTYTVYRYILYSYKQVLQLKAFNMTINEHFYCSKSFVAYASVYELQCNYIITVDIQFLQHTRFELYSVHFTQGRVKRIPIIK